MPGPTDPIDNSMPAEDSFLELLAETLENLDRPARGQFLQRFFKTIAHLELTDAASLDQWDQILSRQRELREESGKPVSLKRAIVDVLASSSLLRVPVLIEYDELKKLEISAATDSLTELFNRRFFEGQCDKELNRALRYNQNLAIVMLDLHQFKEVNDRYGHPRGDALLRMAAATLRNSLRTSDYAFRIGGDEFALLLVQSDAEQAITLARRIRANFTTATAPMEMTLSTGLDYGVAVYPNDGDQKEVLIRVADERLYEMKRSQRDARSDRRAVAPQETAATPPGAAAHGSTSCFDCDRASVICRHRAAQVGTCLAGRNESLRAAARRGPGHGARAGLGLRRRGDRDESERGVGWEFQRHSACADSAAGARQPQEALRFAQCQRTASRRLRLRHLNPLLFSSPSKPESLRTDTSRYRPGWS